jgi:peptidyl-dipeptidase Dcp
MTNPFFMEWDTPFGIAPFNLINPQHYPEAFDKAFSDQNTEIESIIDCSQTPSFLNTIEALERSGALLRKVARVFFNLTASSVTDDLQEIELEIVPKYAAHNSRMYKNPRLFARVQSVYESRENLCLDADQLQLLEDTHRVFLRTGAALGDASRSEIQGLDEELAALNTRFGQNILKETNSFELVLESAKQAMGIPAPVLQAAMEEGERRGRSGKYVFTISRSSMTPFLQFAEDRGLREKLYKAYTCCASNDNEHNNQKILKTIVSLRARKAKLLGFENHAHYMLDDRMAKTVLNVTKLLDKIWAPTKDKVAMEAEDLQAKIQDEGGNFELRPWDWWYYTEKIRSERYDLDEAQVKPYFKLENVRDGAFEVATRLYGITFKEVSDIPRYHPDVVGYEVRDADGSLIGLFLVDYFMRSTKRSGAWMDEFRGQSNVDQSVRPIIVNCCNFPKADPCLLGMEEVQTLFHEFGHALHGLLSQVRYESQSGTNVKQDFVELPSQIMEHWAIQPEVLRSYARHVDTDEVIPDETIDKLVASRTFNQGFATTEYLAAAYLDMAWHTLGSDEPLEVDDLEEKALRQIQLIDTVGPRYQSSYFQHIFSDDDYSAGYYSYIWAEVLDADGFEAFRENGIFDAETARSFRENVLERGGTSDPMDLYRNFRGHEPEVEPLLKNRGLV